MRPFPGDACNTKGLIMRRKKIVFVFRNMGTGGAQKIEAFVANAMLEEGHEVIAVNMAASACTVNIDPQIKIVNVLYDSVEKCTDRLSKPLRKAAYLLRLRKALLALKPDLVCAFLSDVVRITVLAMKGTNIPIVGSERADPFEFTESQFEKYKKAYARCKGVVFQLDNVARKYALPDTVVQAVIPNPCVPRKRAYSVCADKTNHVIMSAGRLSEQKRFDLLVDAFATVHEHFPNYRLHIYGDGPLKESLTKRINESTAKDAIILKGDVEDVFNIANDSEFFVLSSDYEGIPNVLIEAMSCGMACVSTDCSPGGARYLLQEGARGLIAPCGDADKLAAAMMTYINDPELRIANQEKGLQVIEELAPQNIKNMWIDLFHACL